MTRTPRIMKVPAIGILITILAAFSGCSESKEAKVTRLKLEAEKIQADTARTILEYDMKFMRDLDEEDEVYAGLEKDMERCKEITAELKQISPDIDLSKLESEAAIILTAIDDRQLQTKRDREVDLDKVEPMANTEEIVAALERTLEMNKKAGRDTKEIEQLLNQMKQQKQDAPNQTDPENNTPETDKAQ